MSYLRQLIFTISTGAAVVTNAALVVFTMNYLDDRSIQYRFWFFCIFQWVMFGFLVLLAEAIPDIPSEISIQFNRQRILVEKAIFRLKDAEKAEVSIDPTTTPAGTASSGLNSSPSFSSADRFYIHDYRSFVTQQKYGHLSSKKQFSNKFVSNRLFDIFADDHEDDEVASSEGTELDRSHHSPMPAVYSLPSPGRKGKYSYTRSSTAVSATSRVIDDEESEEEVVMDKEV